MLRRRTLGAARRQARVPERARELVPASASRRARRQMQPAQPRERESAWAQPPARVRTSAPERGLEQRGRPQAATRQVPTQQVPPTGLYLAPAPSAR